VIYRTPGQPWETSCQAPSGLVGTIGVRVEEGEGTTVTARTTAGSVEHPAASGLYWAVLAAPLVGGQYAAVWDTGGAIPVYGIDNEYLTVTYTTPDAPATVPGERYATITDVRAYTSQAVGVSDEDLQAILDHAERDIDGALIEPVPWGRIDATGLKYDPTSLETWRAAALNRATCAQTEYRLAMGEEFFIRAQHPTERGPDFAVSGLLPYIGPKALRELAGSLLVATPGVGQIQVGGTIMSSSTGWVDTNTD
jgi:hypothetical protein